LLRNIAITTAPALRSIFHIARPFSLPPATVCSPTNYADELSIPVNVAAGINGTARRERLRPRLRHTAALAMMLGLREEFRIIAF